jgi:EpsI family protein
MSNKSFLISCIGLLVTMTLTGYLSIRPEPVVVMTNLEKLPMTMAGYRGSVDRFPDSVYRELNADDNLYRHYRSEDGSQLDLYIGYYGTAKGGRTGHNPYACLPGAGWAIVDTQKIGIRQPFRSTPAEVNYVQARRDGMNTIMVHWYQTDGKTVVSTGIQQNVERFWGRLLRNRDDGAFVQITTLVADDQLPGGKSKLLKFAETLLQNLSAYWPIER